MDIDFRIKQLEDFLLKDSPKIPFSGNRAVNEADARNLLEQLRAALPEELSKAQHLLEQGESVLTQAREEAERIIAAAQEEAQQMAGEHRVMQEARHQAGIVRQRAHDEAIALRADADEYVFNMLSQLQQELARLQRTVDNGLQKLEADRELRLQG